MGIVNRKERVQEMQIDCKIEDGFKVYTFLITLSGVGDFESRLLNKKSLSKSSFNGQSSVIGMKMWCIFHGRCLIIKVFFSFVKNIYYR